MMVIKPCTVQAARSPLFLLPSVVLLAAFAQPALAQGTLPATPPRTVTWYADNPRARASVQLACLDDPGRLGRSPDCINAHQANVEVAVRDARTRTGTMDPRDPAFWSNSPQARQAKLAMCRHTPTVLYCDVARRSLLIEAGKLQR